MHEPQPDNLRSHRRFLSNRFDDPAIEKLYQIYSIKQKRNGLECFLITSILYDIYTLTVPNEQDAIVYVAIGTFLALNLVLLVWCKRWNHETNGDDDAIDGEEAIEESSGKRGKKTKRGDSKGKTAGRRGRFLTKEKCFWPTIPHLSWHLANLQLLASLFLKKNEVTSRDSLGWVLLLDYLIYVTLPLRLRHCVVLSFGTCASYLATIVGLSKNETNFFQQHITNCILLVTANLLALTSYQVEEKQQRRAFLETRQSLEVKLVIEEQSAEQERLLLSVLPEHVAVQMRQDLDRADSQFKKIYMSRHENVSILYADIVGFTAISSTYSAQELVKMLNDLFARFDKLAEKYQQLRIKILGDCYYCISGAPKESTDHAVLCVHMGLSMVKAIKYVQQTTNSPVDMRVGIHTGAVLAGVLGQRQWQFDVYSKDVELANKMESSGKAGRVHISATTLSFLSGEFEVEPAYGEKRDESLRIAGLKTYFIVKVLKPFESKQEVHNGGSIMPEEDSCVIADLASDSKDEDANDEGEQLTSRSRQDTEDFKRRLRKELVNRDGHRELAKSTKFLTSAFVNPEIERQYLQHAESISSVTPQAFLIVRFAIGLSELIVLPRRLMNLLSFVIGNVVLLLITLTSFSDILPSKLCSCLSNCQTLMNRSLWLRRILATTCIVLLTAANIVDALSCATSHQQHHQQHQDQLIQQQLQPQRLQQQQQQQQSNCSITDDTNVACLYPSYFSYFAVLILIAASLPASLSYLCKSLLMVLVTVAHCAVNVLILSHVLDCEESRKHWSNFTKGKYTLSALLLTSTLALSLLARHLEQVSRVLFLWRSEVEEQRECATDMRRRNEALVYNILPAHVAEHFMFNNRKKRREHDDLYSQSYAEVGVLFASMPNFSDFYSEESVNNQGLECLRFLNEVISDFDALLEWPQFQDVIKIKTIGSTYMAASGLNPARQVKADDPITTRWAHLALLVEFALELKKALQCINEQSFNHFVLKLGINHGPITAGVIGARKPHYDIWGNTVNVASRMESTGKAGCIQVTQETCEILQCFGYEFEQRGLVAVKGKGQLMTYYLLGKTIKKVPSMATMEKREYAPASGQKQHAAVEERDAIACGDIRIEDARPDVDQRSTLSQPLIGAGDDEDEEEARRECATYENGSLIRN